jgi:Omp85 superfamily domain
MTPRNFEITRDPFARRPRGKRRGAMLAMFMLFLSLATASAAQSVNKASTADPADWTTPAVDPMDDPGGESASGGGSSVTPLAAPIPFKNSQLGWGLGLMIGAIHRFDPDTTLKPSIGAVMGFYTENKSWGLAAMEMARLQHDRWRLRGMLSHMDLRYDYYGIGQDAGEAGHKVGIDQTMTFGAGAGLRRITSGLYLGPSIVWMQTTSKLQNGAPPDAPPPTGDMSQANLLAPGIQAELDTRNDDYWPSQGSVARIKSAFFSSALGSSRDFQRYSGGWSWYTKLRGKHLLLATNVNGAAALGDVPFYALPSIGAGQGGLRGYTQGRYRDNVMTTAQAELRMHTDGRLGATIFGGFGQVAQSFSKITNAQALPAGGLGLRFQLTRNFPMHMRFDYAWGKNGNIGYFGVSEAF